VFEDSTFASTARRNPRSGWAAALSFAFQSVVLGIFVLIPLLYTDALPVKSLAGYIELPQPPARQAPPQQPIHEAVARRPVTEIRDNVLVQPHTIPNHITQVIDPPGPPPAYEGPSVVGIDGGSGNGSSFVNSIIAHSANSVAPPPPPSHQTIKLSGGVTDGLLVHKVTPVYPMIARQTHTQGAVVIQAVIGRDGRIENLQLISGNPLLVNAAMEAVKQWRYRPYLLSNEPVEVETQITVNFTLGG
jgi:protein TonB